MKVCATVHGAVSIVNAIATRKGATLGIGLEVNVTAESIPGRGISIHSENKSLSSRLIKNTVEMIVPRRTLESCKIRLVLDSEIPTGYGLKSSSAISSAVALACAKIFHPKLTDRQIILAGVRASISSKVSITGAYDDACSCYYGGFNVTDNAEKKRHIHERAPSGLCAVIFVPRNRKRGNLKKLKNLSAVFENAWKSAISSKYWEAMTINGLATATILNSDPMLVAKLLEAGAYGASVSGNGPAIAAITKKNNESAIKKIFDGLEGRVIVSRINNKEASVREV
ncbi:MAG: shikimate kinase [Thaumarchaeota archaeon]|nr:shikimate kinase [Nitrososphaerota archaeon]